MNNRTHAGGKKPKVVSRSKKLAGRLQGKSKLNDLCHRYLYVYEMNGKTRIAGKTTGNGEKRELLSDKEKTKIKINANVE